MEPDPIAVDRAVRGDNPPRLRPSEIREAVRVLVIQRGLQINEAARRIGACTRTVARHRDALVIGVTSGFTPGLTPGVVD